LINNISNKLFFFYIIYTGICLFPLWVFRSNLDVLGIIINLIVFFFIIIAINFFVVKKNYQKFNFFFILWLTLITFYGFDQNLGLWNLFSQKLIFFYPFYSPYVTALLNSFLFISIIFILLRLTKNNGIKILFSALLIVFVFNFLDENKQYSNFPSTKIKEPDLIKKEKKKIIIIFDEMSGLNSEDKKVFNGEVVDNFIMNYFKKNKFDIYKNAFSLFRDTDKSLGSLLNFNNNKNEYYDSSKIYYPVNDKKKDVKYMKYSSNYFIENEIINNKFFDLDINQNIVVFQSMYINFCNHPKVIICNQYNPYNKNVEFLNGFKDTLLTRYISFFRNNGSVTSYLAWRLLLEFRLIDSLLDPVGEKASINYIFDELFKNIKTNEDTSLFFSHILVPHIPYAYNEECNFDGNLQIDFNRISVLKKRIRHNIERKCTIEFLDIFFKKLKQIKKFDDFEIVIFSDHDSRILTSENIINNVIFVHKKVNSKKSKIIEETASINELFGKLFK
jgi:hypothetical protein